jgi:hypothetical protein
MIIGFPSSLGENHRIMENFDLDKIRFDLKLDIAVEGTHNRSVIVDGWKSSTHGVIDWDISPEFHLPCSLCCPLCALFLSFLSLESIVEFEFEWWKIRFLYSSFNMCR